MKKRTLMLMALVASVAMLSFAVFAGNDGYEGYERFKDMLRNQEDVNMKAVTGQVEVWDNGESLVKVDGTFVGSKDDQVGSGEVNIQSSDLQKTLKFYGQDEKMYIVDDQDVYVKAHDESEAYEGRMKRDHEGFDKNSEAVLDFFMGDLKDDFEAVKDDDGTVDIVFELTSEEMPALFNLMASSKEGHEMDDYEHHDMLKEYPLFVELESLKDLMPELEISELTRFMIRFDMNGDNVEGVEFEVKWQGTDTDGNIHDMMIKGQMASSDEGSVETFVITDENVYELPEHESRRR